MAKPAPSEKPTVITVEAGDTLSQIAKDYLGSASKYKELASKNGISNPNHIYIGQKITLSGSGSGSGSSSSSSKPTSTKLKITAFGLSAASASSNTLFAVWTCGRDHIKNYTYEWQYTTGDKAEGKDVWYKGNSGDTKDKYETNCMYGIPTGAKKVRFRVKPVSETYKSGSGSDQKDVAYFTDASWVGFDNATTYDTKNVPPEVPGKIEAKIDHNRMVLKVEISEYPVDELTKDELSSTKVEIQVIANDKTLVTTAKDVTFNDKGYASWEYSVTEGNRYRVRCRVVRGDHESAWSSYTQNESSVPAATTFVDIKPIQKATDGTFNVYLEWNKSATAEKYTIEYLGVQPGDTPQFDNITPKPPSVSTEDASTNITISNVSTGAVYYFRIAAEGAGGNSKWSEVSGGLTIGTPPGPPTTWSSSNTVVIGEPLYFYWVHNPTDGSSETASHLHVDIVKVEKDAAGNETETIVNGKGKGEDFYPPKTPANYDDKDETSFYEYKTDLISNPLLEQGTLLRWRVQTAGVTEAFGNDPEKNWSVTREVKIYSPPELTFTVKPHGDIEYTPDDDVNNTDFICTSFPLTVNATSGPQSQIPTSYYISITSNDVYETVDNLGNNKTVGVGDIVYSKYFDVSSDHDIKNHKISASDVNLDNGINYTIECVVSMNSGLSARKSMNFDVRWTDEAYEPWAQVVYDPETLVTNIRPYCERYTTHYFKVVQSGRQYLTTKEPASIAWGEPATTSTGGQIFTSTGELVYSGITTDTEGNYLDGEILYYEVKEGTLIEGVTLSVYRREYDGRFTEIATGIDNTKNTFVTDPHPALDYARYRIVATVDDTGAVSYSDLPGVYIGEPGIVIQWGEEWTSFDVDPNVTDSLSRPNWAGSLLRLPYNVDVSPSYSIEATMIEYAGREHPVSYYGTQLGETATWSTTIPKSDKETIYALHRLAKWTGNVYAREPSGTGYWAHVTVQFPQKHLEQTISVSLTLTRVEGGM